MDFLCGILSLILIVGFVFMFIKINYIDHYYADKKKNNSNPNIYPPLKQEINKKINEVHLSEITKLSPAIPNINYKSPKPVKEIEGEINLNLKNPYKNIRVKDRLPPELDLFLKRKGARYEPQRENYVVTNFDLKIYLGTYFPRSYVETQNILCTLLRNEVIFKSLCQKNRISVLDVGAGTGACTLGLLDAFCYSCVLSKKPVQITAYDRSIEALSIFQEMLNEFHSETNINSNFVEHHFKTCDLNSFCKQNHFAQIFDIIICSKFISEMAVGLDRNETQLLYKNFINYSTSLLSKNGFIILIDKATKTPCDQNTWYPNIINKSIREIINCKNADISYILPLPCSRWSDMCGLDCYTSKRYKISSLNFNVPGNSCFEIITFSVLSKRSFSENVIRSSKGFSCDGYIKSHSINRNNHICSNAQLFGNDFENKYVDAFSLD